MRTHILIRIRAHSYNFTLPVREPIPKYSHILRCRISHMNVVRERGGNSTHIKTKDSVSFTSTWEDVAKFESVPYVGFSNLVALESLGELKKKWETPMLKHHLQNFDLICVEWGVVSFRRLPDDLNMYPGLATTVVKCVS